MTTAGPGATGELLQQYPSGQRITGWDWNNPSDVERAFRVGYVIGAARSVEDDLEDANAEFERLLTRRGDIYCGELNLGFDRWSDRRAALLRGASHGVIAVIRARAQGVKRGLRRWIGELNAWAGENPINLKWLKRESAGGGAWPPEPDGPPLGRADVPRQLWGDTFGIALLPQGNESTGNLTDQAVVSTRGPKKAAPAWMPVLTCLGKVLPQPVRWLWPGRFALGKLTLLVGDPGLGKSFLTLDMAARVSSGTSWPDLPLLPNQRGDVILLSAEDDPADTIRPRMDAAGANVSRVFLLQAMKIPDPKTGDTRTASFTLTTDLPALETAFEAMGDCRLVIIDPVSAYLGSTDSHVNAEVRAVLAPLSELAARRGVAVVAVSHLRKSEGPAIYRTMGSLAFVAAARAAWAVTKDPNDSTGRRRLFLPVKNNLAVDRDGLAYTLEPHPNGTATVAWAEAPVQVSADDALAPPARQPGPKPVERGEAAEWLRKALAEGPRLAKDVLDEGCNGEGYSKNTLERARQVVGIAAYRPKNPGPWWWKLGDGAEPQGRPPGT